MKESIPFPTKTETNHFNAKETEFLINVINEHTEKLRAKIRIQEFLRRRQMALLLAFVFVFVGGSLLFYFLYSMVDRIAIYVCVILLYSALVMFLYYWLLRMRRRVASEERRLEVVKTQLLEVVRFASQIDDHGSLNLTHRIALRLTLVDAEWVLHWR